MRGKGGILVCTFPARDFHHMDRDRASATYTRPLRKRERALLAAGRTPAIQGLPCIFVLPLDGTSTSLQSVTTYDSDVRTPF